MTSPVAPHSLAGVPRHSPRVTRRAILAMALVAPLSRALGRTPTGGVVRVALPFSLATLDPYSATDPASAFFSAAVADPLFAIDSSGPRHPAAAARVPA